MQCIRTQIVDKYDINNAAKRNINLFLFCLCAGHGTYLGGANPLWG